MDSGIPAPRAGLQMLDFLAVAGYLAITFGIVVWSMRKQKSTEDFFLGGRRMPWLAVGMSLLATLLSTISYLGVPGEVIKNGIAMFTGFLAIPFSMIVVLIVWVPFFMRLRMTSAYDYLEQRFNSKVRLIASTLFVLLRLGWMAMVVYTASMALAEMTRSLVAETTVDPIGAWLTGPGASAPLLRETLIYWVLAAVGLFSTISTCLGGIRAVIWNDVLQFVMLFGGAIITLLYVVWATGSGPVQWWNAVSEHSARHTSPPLFSWDITVRMTVITAMLHSFFWTICTHGSDQVVLQRYFSTTSLKSARKSYIINEVSNVLMGLLLALSGLALLYFYVEHPTLLRNGISATESSDKLLPFFFVHQLPAGIGGLILAGFLCDAMQTLVSGVNSISAVASKDVFNRLMSPKRRWLTELTLARGLTIVMGVLVTGLAYGVAYTAQNSGRNIVDQMPRFFNMFLGPLASLFLIGMFLPRCTARSTIPAIIIATLLSATWSWWGEIAAVLNAWGISVGTGTPTITLAIAVPYVGAFAAAAVLGYLVEPVKDHAGREYTWRAIMKRPPPMDQTPEERKAELQSLLDAGNG